MTTRLVIIKSKARAYPNEARLLTCLAPWTKFSRQDEPWAELSTLEVAACHAMHLLHSIAIRPNLVLKTWPKQLLGSLPLDIALPACSLILE